MQKRYVSLWFRHLATDWFTLRHPQLRFVPFVLRTPVHGRMVVIATNAVAERQGIRVGMTLADARAMLPALEAQDQLPDLIPKLLKRLAEWCIRFSPVVSVDAPDGLLLDVTGCAHLWAGEESYLTHIVQKINKRGYDVCGVMADTVRVAWGTARYGSGSGVISSNDHTQVLNTLPPEALQLETKVIERLHKLGLHRIGQFVHMPRASLRSRFGVSLLKQLDKALGYAVELIEPVAPTEPYQERLPCLEPVVTATAIEIALQQLLERLSLRLQQEQKGLRVAVFKCYRVDGKTVSIDITTGWPTGNLKHLFKLFEIKIALIEPDLGIELFVLEATNVEELLPKQAKMLDGVVEVHHTALAELVDRLSNRIGANSIHRYLPNEHYWPERSIKLATILEEQPTTHWRTDKQRPILLLKTPEPIEVSAPIPDYPPMLFRHGKKVHTIVKADGPERIEQEWWLQQGEHRDYYRVEDEQGNRYWVFRLGHYNSQNDQWFLHGYFA
ncbi:MAG: Y-family DNA polymerase [Cytophagales bacterium]